MPGKVVVGYLDSERGRDALALGRILAKARGSELGVLTVGEGERLAVAAREEGADLVVLGSTHRGAVGRIMPGTTMEHLLGEAPCKVAVAPPGFGDHADGDSVWQPLSGDAEDVGLRVIGVGYDGSRASHQALEAATDLALRNGAALRVYSVVRRSAPIAPGAPMTPTPLATTELESRGADLHRTVADLPPRGACPGRAAARLRRRRAGRGGGPRRRPAGPRRPGGGPSPPTAAQGRRR